MIVWSILTADAWGELQQTGQLRASRQHVEPDFMAAYTWMAEQMERRLIIPRPSKDAMPIWVWSQWWGDRRKPDLRASGHLPKGTRGVRVECKVHDDRLLLSDFQLWHFVLNYGYLPRSEKEGEAFEKELTAAGLSLTGCSLRNPLPHAQYRQKIEQSWERIFDLTWTDPDHAIVPPTKDRSIQGTLWELLLEDVIDANEFAAQ
jgi:hypothetical protein